MSINFLPNHLRESVWSFTVSECPRSAKLFKAWISGVKIEHKGCDGHWRWSRYPDFRFPYNHRLEIYGK